MSIEFLVIGFLVSALAVQQVFWSVVCFKLTNRIMSRDFSEFMRASRPQQSSPPPPLEDAGDTIDEQQAANANKIFGLV